MSKALTFITFIIGFSAIHLTAQPYAVGHTTLSLTDASRSNRSVPVEVYYPAATAGDNVPVTGNKKFPVISFGHGFVMTWDAYKNVWNALVPEGIIVAFPKRKVPLRPLTANLEKTWPLLLQPWICREKTQRPFSTTK